jgi:AcrR family transcriptional regulator
VPRTIDLEKHTVRREAFIEVAQQLITTKGYEQMSIQDVLDALETSRGAFYHYFDSKQALLDGVVDRFADMGMATVPPILNDSRMTALQKLERIVVGIAQFKAGQKDFVLALIEVMNSDGNALFRDKIRRMTASRLMPILSAVIRQGIDEGEFTPSLPEETAQMIVSLVQGYQMLAGEQFVARQAGAISFDVVKRTYAAFTEALERILGIPKGAATFMDEATLRFWFD